MTFGQWKRLLIVLAIPLLFAGWLLTRDEDPSAHITCLEGYVEKCVNWGAGFDERELKLSQGWFGIGDLGDSYNRGPAIFSKGSLRQFKNAKVMKTGAYGSSDVREIGLLDNEVTIVLGAKPELEGYDVLLNQPLTLMCYDLVFQGLLDHKAMECRSSNWYGWVEFSLSGDEHEKLNSLRYSHAEARKQVRTDYFASQIILYPSLLYLFLFLSGIIWSSVKAYRFVKAG